MKIVGVALVIVGFLVAWGTEGNNGREVYDMMHGIPFTPFPVWRAAMQGVAGLLLFATGVFVCKRARRTKS